MHDTRKFLDEQYRAIALLEQRISEHRARIEHEQRNCFHDKRADGWCEDCDKHLGGGNAL